MEIKPLLIAVPSHPGVSANIRTAQVTKSSLFAAAGQVAIAVFGVVWMSSTFMDYHGELIKNTLGEVVGFILQSLLL